MVQHREGTRPAAAACGISGLSTTIKAVGGDTLVLSHDVGRSSNPISCPISSVTRLEVSQGQTIDFVVDINKELNSDQFAWRIEITDMRQPEERWDSKEDFTRSTVRRLSPLEQLAHVLLCTNEFLFVD